MTPRELLAIRFADPVKRRDLLTVVNMIETEVENRVAEALISRNSVGLRRVVTALAQDFTTPRQGADGFIFTPDSTEGSYVQCRDQAGERYEVTKVHWLTLPRALSPAREGGDDNG